MRVDRPSQTIMLLHLLVWAAVVLPISLFAYVGWAQYQSLRTDAAERVERTVDVVHDHALLFFQTIEQTISETIEIVRGLDDDTIRARAEELHPKLRRLGSAPLIEAIWILDRNAHPVVTSAIHPLPQAVQHGDREYFRAHVVQDAGTHVGDLLTTPMSNQVVLVVSRRRTGSAGAFNGVVAVSVARTPLQDYYVRVAQDAGLSVGLVRADGTVLVRHPTIVDGIPRLRTDNRFVSAIASEPQRGAYTAVSPIDGIERRSAYRKLPGYEAYVQAGVDSASVWRELARGLAVNLAFGLPAMGFVLVLSYLALKRTRAFLGETQRREAAEAAVKQAQRMEAVGQVTDGVAHDFNNLLMVVNGNVERLRRDLRDPRHRRALDAIDKAVRRGESLTRQLLTFSRRQSPEPTVIELRRQLPKIREMLQSSLRGDIAIALDIPTGLWPVRVDIGELELAILNLGSNARDAMPNGGTLTLSARNTTLGGSIESEGPTGDFVAVAVRDTGVGIRSDVLPKVFDPFFTTKDVGRGTGIGLSQVYEFASESGGTATVSSELGRGTEVTIYLPRCREALPGQEPASQGSPEADTHALILLVEDNTEIADVSKANLEELGYRVLHAPNAAAAMEVVERDRTIDLVFSDIVMPGSMSGLDLARRLRDLRPGLPIVLTTGYNSALESAAPEGFTLLTKPYDQATLHRAIAETLRERGAKVMPLMLRRRE
jgi:two-component system, NtrC family, sensor kinase